MRYNYKLFDRAIPGQREGSVEGMRVRSLIWKGDGTKEVWTITIPASPVADTTYVVKINGLATAQFKTDASPTQAELRDGMLTALRTNPVVGSQAVPSLSGNNILLTAHNYGLENIFTSTNLTVAKTTAGVMPGVVPLGRFVARAAAETNPDVAKLPTATTDKIIGITHRVYDLERSDTRSGSNRVGYPYNEVMDVVDRVGTSTGIWVECFEADITINDGVYVSVAAGNEGKVTKTNSGTIDISSRAAFLTAPVSTSDGKMCVLVSFNNL